MCKSLVLLCGRQWVVPAREVGTRCQHVLKSSAFARSKLPVPVIPVNCKSFYGAQNSPNLFHPAASCRCR